MSEYLSAIVTRGIDALSALQPNIQAGYTPAEHSSFEDTLIAPETPAFGSDASYAAERAADNTTPPVHTTVTIQSPVIQPSTQPVLQEKTDTGKSDIIPYMAGHVDRLMTYNNSLLRERVIETSKVTTVKPPSPGSSSTEKNTGTDIHDIRDDSGVETEATKASPTKLSNLIPSVKRAPQSPSAKAGILPRLMPEILQPVQTQAVIHGAAGIPQKQNAAPKLVIGKITVEVIPPAVAPPPQKIITRTVQTSSSASPSKNNRLSFGLGQL